MLYAFSLDAFDTLRAEERRRDRELELRRRLRDGAVGSFGPGPIGPRRGRRFGILDGIGRLLAGLGRGLRALAEAATPHGYPAHHF